MIELQNVSKSFRKHLIQFNTFKSFILNFKKRTAYQEKIEMISPVNNLSMTIDNGEVLGVVGRNGAGKSTLAKLIAGTMEPSSGRVITHGKIVPFLELGVAFSNELTSTDNLYLNGVMLGLSLSYLKQHKQAIFKFAGLEDFQEMPLKFYSSGMQLRLAFSIAMHAVGDIYIFDEILAVGDESFQKKCFDSFEGLLKAKKTIILISHDFGLIKKHATQLLALTPTGHHHIQEMSSIAHLNSVNDLMDYLET